MIIGMFGSFCFLLKWQMYHARLHLPVLIAACPLAAVALSRAAFPASRSEVRHRVSCMVRSCVSIWCAVAHRLNDLKHGPGVGLQRHTGSLPVLLPLL